MLMAAALDLRSFVFDIAVMQRLNELDLNLFVAFQALYRERSVTKAAEQLGLTQPAMSHKLRRLRDALNDPLFVSSPQGLLPTPTAEALSPIVHEALSALDSAVGATHFDPATSERHFVLQMADLAEMMVLPKALRLLQEEAPGVTLEVVPPGPRTGEALERGDVDLGFGAGMSLPGSARTTRLTTDGFVVLSRTGHPATADGLTMQAYLEANHVVVAPRGGPRTFVDQALEAAGHRRKIACRLRRFVTAPFLVAESDNLFTAPRSLYRTLKDRLPLEAHDVPFTIEPVVISMFWHERMHSDPGHIWMRELAMRTRDRVEG